MRAAYIYYRVAPEHSAAIVERVALQMQAMRAFCSLPPRLMQRCDDNATWMEIYEDIPDWPAFVDALERAATETGLASFLASERHIECFLSRDTKA